MLTIFLALAAAGLTADPKSPRILNLPELVTEEDYPPVAIARGEQGSVQVRVGVDTSGMVTSCAVIESSGSKSLDEQTCALFRTRARFEPGMDGRGRPAMADFTQRIIWRVEGKSPPPVPRQYWKVQITLAFTAEGKLKDCKMEPTGFKIEDDGCKHLMRSAEATAGVAQASEPAVSDEISEVVFYPLPPATAPRPLVLDAKEKIAREVSELEIATDGAMTRCEIFEYTGQAHAGMSACKAFAHQMFEPIPEGGNPLIGTWVVTI